MTTYLRIGHRKHAKTHSQYQKTSELLDIIKLRLEVRSIPLAVVGQEEVLGIILGSD